MPRAEGKCCLCSPGGNWAEKNIVSWDPQISCEQDEVEGAAAPAVVLPSLRETVQR